MIWCGGLSHSNEMMWWAAGKLGAKSNGLLNEALCKKVMSDLLKTSAPAQHPLWGYRHRVRIMFQGGKQGSAARAGLYLIIADVSLKSLRSSYTGLCLQSSGDGGRGAARRGVVLPPERARSSPLELKMKSLVA